ncbi:MAG: VWA domain-containing protein [Proteobacteria bacterium]|nr:VWA domain-containing protein [Pseudomonadota bacterium]
MTADAGAGLAEQGRPKPRLNHHIHEFARLLRQNGVRVSTAEIADAVRAVAAVRVGDPAEVRATLGTTLIKRTEDRPTFDELFELYFCRASALSNALDSQLLSPARQNSAGDPVTTEFADQIVTGAAALNSVARMGLGLRAPEIAALVQRAAHEVDLDGIRTPLQVGYYGYQLAEVLGLAQAEAAALDMIDRAAASAGLADATRDAVRAEVVRNFAVMRDAVREYVARAFARQNLDYRRTLALGHLAEKPLSSLTDNEIAELRRELLRLARMMRTRFAQRPEKKKRGRLDLGRTLRKSLASGGIPFDIHWRERRKRKPRLIVLCDISDSVRNVSRFMLELVYTLQELFDRVTAFAFVAELGELTDLFRQYEIDRAIALAYSGTVVNTFANSNYGRTFEQFAERYMDRVTGRTTVIIIGDGRNNYHTSHASLLGDIRRRAKQVLWLNPEPRALWGFGDSAMAEYEPYCDRVMVVRNLDGLREAIDRSIL